MIQQLLAGYLQGSNEHVGGQPFSWGTLALKRGFRTHARFASSRLVGE
jgi:hypothetical protein